MVFFRKNVFGNNVAVQYHLDRCHERQSVCFTSARPTRTHAACATWHPAQQVLARSKPLVTLSCRRSVTEHRSTLLDDATLPLRILHTVPFRLCLSLLARGE